MQGKGVTNKLSRGIYSYAQSEREKQEDEKLSLLTTSTRYENDAVVRALSVNHGYFIKSERNTHCQRDPILSEFIHSEDSDVFKLRIHDLRKNTKVVQNMNIQKDGTIFFAYFRLLYFRQYMQYEEDYDRYWRQNKAERVCTDWVEYAVPFVYCYIFTYFLFPLYMISRVINVFWPFLVLLAVLNGTGSGDWMELSLAVFAAVNIAITVIVGLILIIKIRKMYVILIFDIAFGVLDIQFATGYDGSAYYAFKYILKYYGFGRLLQVIKPILIEKFGNDIASIIMYYWLSFDHLMEDLKSNN